MSLRENKILNLDSNIKKLLSLKKIDLTNNFNDVEKLLESEIFVNKIIDGPAALLYLRKRSCYVKRLIVEERIRNNLKDQKLRFNLYSTYYISSLRLAIKSFYHHFIHNNPTFLNRTEDSIKTLQTFHGLIDIHKQFRYTTNFCSLKYKELMDKWEGMCLEKSKELENQIDSSNDNQNEFYKSVESLSNKEVLDEFKKLKTLLNDLESLSLGEDNIMVNSSVIGV